MTIPFEMGKTSDGKDMIDLKSYKYKFDVKDGATYQLTNLFNGNKVLGKLITVLKCNFFNIIMEKKRRYYLYTYYPVIYFRQKLLTGEFRRLINYLSDTF